MMRLKTDRSILSGTKKSKERFFYAAAFLLPAALMLGICILMRITPFGEESFLIADMKKQYVDYLSYYKSIFRGENDMFYTFGKCLGGDMIGFFAYYLTSPFNLLFLFVKNEWIPAGITVLIVLKAGGCGAAMAYYLRRRFRTEEYLKILVFSVSYAMTGYLMTNSFNIMWLDALIWLPVTLYGIEKIVQGMKPYTYIGGLFMVLFCNYYIGYMVCIFCVLYLGYRLAVVGAGDRILRKLWRFAYGSLLAAGLCAVFLLPAFFTLQGSLKDGKDLGAGITLPDLNPVRVLAKLFTASFSENELMNGMPNIFCGILVFVLTVLFFFNRKIAVRERVLSGVLLAVLMGSFCSAEVDFVWHAFMEPSGYHYRYAFLFSFLIIVFSFQGFLQLEQGLGGRRFLYAAGVFLALLFLVFRQYYEFLNVRKALPDMVLLFVLLMCLYLRTKGERFRNLFFVLAAVQVLNLSWNGAFVYLKLRNTSYCTAGQYKEDVLHIGPVVEAVKETDGGVYRMENLEPKGNNDSMQFSYAGLTHYSSNEKNFVLSFLEKMGLNYNRLYVEYGTGTTQTADSLLGVKYLLGSEESLNKPYDEVLETQGMTAYRNPYALPLAFLAGKGVARVDMEEENPFLLQNEMYGQAAGAKEGIFRDTFIREVRKENCREEKKGVSVLYEREEEGMPVGVTYEMEAQAEGRIYAYLTAEGVTQPAEVYVDGEFLCGYLNRSNWKILNLGEYRKGERISFSIRTDAETLFIEQAYFVTEDREILEEQYREIMEEPAAVTKKSNSRLIAETQSGEEKMLVFSIPYETDWKVTVDGKRVAAEKAYDTFLAVPLDAGKHRIELRYIPKGFAAGAAASLACAGILLGMAVRDRKKEGKRNGKEKMG